MENNVKRQDSRPRPSDKSGMRAAAQGISNLNTARIPVKWLVFTAVPYDLKLTSSDLSALILNATSFGCNRQSNETGNHW